MGPSGSDQVAEAVRAGAGRAFQAPAKTGGRHRQPAMGSAWPLKCHSGCLARSLHDKQEEEDGSGD